MQQVFDPQTQLLVLEEDVTEGDEELRRAGQQGAQCGTGDFHPGSTEFAEDEGIVGDQVDHEGHARLVPWMIKTKVVIRRYRTPCSTT